MSTDEIPKRIELFNVEYRPAIGAPEIRLLCQGVKVGEETLLWVDGVNPEDPVMVPLGSVRRIEWAGSWAEFMRSHLDLAAQVLESSQGEHSTTIVARATLYMASDSRLSASEALDHAYDQALDLIDADNLSAYQFSVANQQAAAMAA